MPGSSGFFRGPPVRLVQLAAGGGGGGTGDGYRDEMSEPSGATEAHRPAKEVNRSARTDAAHEAWEGNGGPGPTLLRVHPDGGPQRLLGQPVGGGGTGGTEDGGRDNLIYKPDAAEAVDAEVLAEIDGGPTSVSYTRMECEEAEEQSAAETSDEENDAAGDESEVDQDARLGRHFRLSRRPSMVRVGNLCSLGCVTRTRMWSVRRR